MLTFWASIFFIFTDITFIHSSPDSSVFFFHQFIAIGSRSRDRGRPRSGYSCPRVDTPPQSLPSFRLNHNKKTIAILLKIKGTAIISFA